jgi:hypothetical protein
MSDLQTSNVAVIRPPAPPPVVKKKEPEQAAAPDTGAFGPAVVLSGAVAKRVEPVETDVKTAAPPAASAKTDAAKPDATPKDEPPPPVNADNGNSINLHV